MVMEISDRDTGLILLSQGVLYVHGAQTASLLGAGLQRALGEYQALGLPCPSASKRVDQLEEILLKQAMTGGVYGVQKIMSAYPAINRFQRLCKHPSR
jgi:hypothetical protein